MTEVWLFENELLHKKIEHIKDLCEEAVCLEDVEAMEREFHKIIDICNNKCCNNCKWWEREDITNGMVCVNADSEHCTCWTEGNHTCNAFEKREIKENKNDIIGS